MEVKKFETFSAFSYTEAVLNWKIKFTKNTLMV